MLVGTVQEQSTGRKGVSVQVNMEALRSRYDRETRNHFKRYKLSRRTITWYDLSKGENLSIMDSDVTEGAAHAARLAFELGCQVVKQNGPVQSNHFVR